MADGRALRAALEAAQRRRKELETTAVLTASTGFAAARDALLSELEPLRAAARDVETAVEGAQAEIALLVRSAEQAAVVQRGRVARRKFGVVAAAVLVASGGPIVGVFSRLDELPAGLLLGAACGAGFLLGLLLQLRLSGK